MRDHHPSSTAPQLVLLFPGQRSQHYQMARELLALLRERGVASHVLPVRMAIDAGQEKWLATLRPGLSVTATVELEKKR